jgi:hypothetical protein
MLRMIAGKKTSSIGCLGIGVLSVLVGVSKCSAQGKPVEDCKFAYAGFATSPREKVQIAEVSKRTAIQLEMCGSPKGCVEAPVAQGTPVQIYRQQGAWTCGYISGHDGSGPAWILNDALRIDPYDENSSLSAWGVWNGGEDHVRIRLGNKPRTLLLVGNAVLQAKYTSHLANTKGLVVPVGNHLHFVENGSGSCTIDLILLNRYILAEDNETCGALNARFQGIWKRASP